MSKRTTGVVFIAIAAFLYATRMICGILLITNLKVNFVGNHEMFVLALDTLGPGLTIFSLLSLVIGASYLMWADLGGILTPLKAQYDLVEEQYSYEDINPDKKMDGD